jgi:hypothetical protein
LAPTQALAKVKRNEKRKLGQKIKPIEQSQTNQTKSNQSNKVKPIEQSQTSTALKDLLS